VQEIFAVQILRGMRFPELLEWNDSRLGNSYVLPVEALADVPLVAEDMKSQTPEQSGPENLNPKQIQKGPVQISKPAL